MLFEMILSLSVDYRVKDCVVICWRSEKEVIYQIDHDLGILNVHDFFENEIVLNDNNNTTYTHTIIAYSIMNEYKFKVCDEIQECIIGPEPGLYEMNHASLSIYSIVQNKYINNNNGNPIIAPLESMVNDIVDFLSCQYLPVNIASNMISPFEYNSIKLLCVGYGSGELTRRLYEMISKRIDFVNIDIYVDAIEIDEMMIEIGKEWLQLCIDNNYNNMNVNVKNCDAKEYIDQIGNNDRYDIIYIDIYDYNSPPQPVKYFYSVEFFKKVKKIWDNNDCKSKNDIINRPKMLISNLSSHNKKSEILQSAIKNAQIAFQRQQNTKSDNHVDFTFQVHVNQQSQFQIVYMINEFISCN